MAMLNVSMFYKITRAFSSAENDIGYNERVV